MSRPLTINLAFPHARKDTPCPTAECKHVSRTLEELITHMTSPSHIENTLKESLAKAKDDRLAECSKPGASIQQISKAFEDERTAISKAYNEAVACSRVVILK